MIEDKIKQEYEWQHREIGQPTLDELFSKINEALGIELWIWQKTYMTMGTYRQMGATTAQCLRVLLFSETTPLDYSSPPRTAIDLYLYFMREANIHKLMQTKEGREYLDNCWRMEQTKPDRKKLREKMRKGER